MMPRPLKTITAVFLAASVLAVSSRFTVKESEYRATDHARGGHWPHEVQALLYVPEGTTEFAPVAAFAHGFGLGASLYPLAKELSSRRGMVVFLPHNLGVVPSTVDLAMDQMFLLEHAKEQARANASSPFYGLVSNDTVLMGHSLGGGSTILAADYTIAGAYGDPTMIIPVSLGVGTIPNALKSAPRISPRVPALIVTASEDCICAPSKYSLPVFHELRTRCALVASVLGGTHCQYASWNDGCHLAELACGAKANITREQQVDAALDLIIPFIDAVVSQGQASAWASFDSALQGSIEQGKVAVLGSRLDDCGAVARDSIDDGFAVECQRQVAGSLPVDIEEQKVGELDFVVTKPELRATAGLAPQVSIVTHLEEFPNSLNFSRSIAVKMKSREAISAGRQNDTVTCKALHEAALGMVLQRLSADERNAYGAKTKKLVFAEDVIWHSGIYVESAHLEASEPWEHVVVVTAPRFDASIKVPGDWGGVRYCRLLLPSTMRDWILSQLYFNEPMKKVTRAEELLV